MASPKEELEKFAQSIYLVRKGRYFDDIAGEDGQVYISQVIDWTNMFIEELTETVNPADGQLVDWWFARRENYTLGTAGAGNRSIGVPSAVERLLTDELRYVQVLQDGTAVSNWAVVHPSRISNQRYRIVEDMCAMVGNTIVFSRAFNDTEQAGTVVGDVMLKIPELTPAKPDALEIVKPSLLLKLGVAKNATLPDIVQGGLSPSYSQKYDALLAGAIARSNASSQSDSVERESFGDVRGVGR